jgi:hypothetical protein
LKIITIVYILNSKLLLLHEIESAYEIEIEKQSAQGLIIGTVLGAGGIIPFFLHKIFVKRPDSFNLLISNSIIYLNGISGLLLACLSAGSFLKG